MTDTSSKTQFKTIQSKIFGAFQVDVDTIVHFPNGIPGLESVTEFAMMSITEYAPIVWMVSLNGVFHFPLVQVNTVDQSDLDNDSATVFKKQLDTYLKNHADEVAYVILKLDKSVTHVSLKAPILVNPIAKTGHQLILDFAR